MVKSNKMRVLKFIVGFAVVLIMLGLSALPVFAAGDVSAAIENTWTTAQIQIKNVVNKVVFPAVDMILAILFFVKLSMSYMDYRKHGQFEFTAPAILFACLVFSLTAPLYIWTILELRGDKMFDWLGDFIEGTGNAICGSLGFVGAEVSNAIWDAMLPWAYEIIYNGIADFFTVMGNMGSDVFELDWVKATVSLFTMFSWALFATGTVVAVFDVAIEYQNGRANIKTTAINVLKGFFACSLFGVVPVELYKFCISLQNTLSQDLSALFASTQTLDLAGQSTSVLEGSFAISTHMNFGLFNLLTMIAFAYCVIKIFFANIKRGGILLIQMAVGSLYMFSVPRGYQDGFNQWMKQIIALCLTAFMQTTLLFLGLLTFPGNMLLGLGIMLSANEVPRIAQQFGLDSSVRVNMTSVIHATTTAVNLTRGVAKAVK